MSQSIEATKGNRTTPSRRSFIAASAIAAAGSSLSKFTTSAQAQTSQGAKAPAAPKSEQSSTAIKTRKASCNCRQLRVTCTGPDPTRISLCQCPLCQKGTGGAFSIQATYPKAEVTIEGKSTAWKFPVEGAPPVSFRNCSRTGVTTHFCPVCGSTVYYVLAETPETSGSESAPSPTRRFHRP